MDIQTQCIKAYRKHKHLKLAAKEVGIPWQTFIVRHMTTINLPQSGGKWRDYEVDAKSLDGFFTSLPPRKNKEEAA